MAKKVNKRDLTDKAQALLNEADANSPLFRSAIENMPLGVSMFDSDDRLIISNERYREIHELPPELMKPGTPFSKIIANTPGHEVKDRGLDETGAERELRYGPDDKVVVREWLLDDGRHIEITVARIADGACIALHEDVTKQRKALDSIVHMARHDTLTDLLNRKRFLELMEEALKSVTKRNKLALLAIDLDGFKSINDTQGHAVGDQLLIAVAERLKECAGENSFVARLGGDEFAIFLNTPDLPFSAENLGHRLIERLRQPFVINGNNLSIGASIGVSIAPEDGMATDTLLKTSDLALYRAKKEGRSRLRFFEPNMLSALNHKRSLEMDLRHAVERGEMELYYQPIWSLAEHRLAGFEALLRWNHSQLGQISPGEFIPIAEETGIIIQIGEWVLQQACADAAKWPDDIRVAVNVSPVQFKSELLDQSIALALQNSGLAPNRLEMEITEGVLLTNTERTLFTLKQIRDLGISISIDDFGTGYASLGYLTQFTFDTLKIDGSFARAASTEKNAQAVMRTIATLGKSLGVTTVAEGIEQKEQLELARDFGCEEIQGYIISRPQPIENFAGMIAESDKDTHWAKSSDNKLAG